MAVGEPGRRRAACFTRDVRASHGAGDGRVSWGGRWAVERSRRDGTRKCRGRTTAITGTCR
jgi:hypothetical protein